MGLLRTTFPMTSVHLCFISRYLVSIAEQSVIQYYVLITCCSSTSNTREKRLLETLGKEIAVTNFKPML